MDPLGSIRVRFNVSGYNFETFLETLNRFPNTLLGDETRRVEYFDSISNAHFINRSAIAFEAILFFYQSNGRLIRPPDLPMKLFEEECKFYDLGEAAIKSMKELEGFYVNVEEPIPIQKQHAIKRIWDFIEEPESSIPAKLFGFLSLMLIFFVVAVDCFGTLESYRKSSILKSLNTVNYYINVFFAAEFVTRMVSTPSKLKFAISIGNVLDFFSIFPSFLLTVIEEKQMVGVLFVRILRTFRVLRLMRLSKNFFSLSVVLNILANCFKDVMMLGFIMIISTILFGSIVYYTELENKNSPISSIPEGMWFAMQTIVTLGYGDIIPVTILGKISAAFTAVIGALTMILPLLSLGGKYFSTYAKTYGIVMHNFDKPLKN